MNKKGVSLIVVLGVLTILLIAASLLINLTNRETRLLKHQSNSVRAFYLAEAGMQEAIYRLQKGLFDNFEGSLYEVFSGGVYEYQVVITGTGPGYTIKSIGAYPDSAGIDRVTRKIRVDVTLTPYGNPGNVTNAITVNGALKIGGAVNITGPVAENAQLDFQTIFGMTKEQVETIASYTYTDPLNNQVPVTRVTWINLVSSATFVISDSNWSGSGILVVKAPAESASNALDITGGRFNGIIWVIGNLRMSGNSHISGSIFVENGSAEITRVTGNPTVAYDASEVKKALDNLGGVITSISNWEEFR